MPTAASSQVLAPSDWEKFENLCADLFADEWEDPHVVRHGRRGQRQHGVDVFGQTKHFRGWPSSLRSRAVGSAEAP